MRSCSRWSICMLNRNKAVGEPPLYANDLYRFSKWSRYIFHTSRYNRDIYTGRQCVTLLARFTGKRGVGRSGVMEFYNRTSCIAVLPSWSYPVWFIGGHTYCDVSPSAGFWRSLLFCPDDGGSVFFRNMWLSRSYTVLQRNRPYSSWSPLREPKIQHVVCVSLCNAFVSDKTCKL